MWKGNKKLPHWPDQKQLFTWIETLSCGRGAKIASLTGSKKYSSWTTGKKCICSNVSESRMVKLAVTCELYAFSGLHFSNSLYRSKQGLLHLKNSEWFVPCSGVGPQLCGQGHIPSSKCTKHTMLGPLLEVREGAAPPPRRIADDHDGGLCFEPVVVVVVVHGCCGYCGWCWCWCWCSGAVKGGNL